MIRGVVSSTAFCRAAVGRVAPFSGAFGQQVRSFSFTKAPLSPMASADIPSLKSLGVTLCVFDMAGTTVDEGGVVYTTLKAAMAEAGWDVPDVEFDKWHGANKKEVVAHFAGTNGVPDQVDAVYANFEKMLEAAYFSDNSPVKPMPGVYEFFAALRAADIKIGLDTGFPRKIADHIIAKLGFADLIDTSVVAMEVGHGRPYPHMIYEIMRQCGTKHINEVAKFGDTVRDIEEGLHAGTPYSFGVLTGADNVDSLNNAGAYRVLGSVVDMPVEEKKQ